MPVFRISMKSIVGGKYTNLPLSAVATGTKIWCGISINWAFCPWWWMPLRMDAAFPGHPRRARALAHQGVELWQKNPISCIPPRWWMQARRSARTRASGTSATSCPQPASAKAAIWAKTCSWTTTRSLAMA